MFTNFTSEECTGTGDLLELTGTTAGGIQFSKSFVDGDEIAYALEDAGGIIKVTGVGIYVAATDDITRNDNWNFNGTVVDTNPATNITLSVGAHTILCGPVADDKNNSARVDKNQTYSASQRGGITALTPAALIASDFNASNFFSVTLNQASTLANPSNLVAGQSGSIFITQDATGSRTLIYDTFWDFANGTPPILSTTANAVDRLDYLVRTTGSIHAQLTRAWS